MAMEKGYSLGPWQPKITRIKQMWLQPCDVNVFVWMLGYFAATPVLATAFLSPDCIDHVADRTRGRPRFRRRGSINVADYADPLHAPGKGEGWVGYKLLNMAQRVGFYLTLIDATQDWVIHGTSFAYQWTGCADPNQGYASVYFDNAFLPGVVGHPFRIGIWVKSSEHIFKAGISGIAAPKGHAVGAAFSLHQKTNQFPGVKDCNYVAWLHAPANKWSSEVQTPVQQADGSRTIMFAAPTTVPLNGITVIQVLYEKTSEGIWYGSGNLTASGTNLEGVAKSACGHNLQGGF